MNIWTHLRFAISHWRSPKSNSQRWLFKSNQWLVTILLTTVLIGMVGCGTNLDLILLRSAEATGRTFLDIFLTDLANTLADQGDVADDNDGDDDISDPPVNNDDDGAGSGGSLDGLVGDPTLGLAIYVDNGCGGCHCDDASGGCALEAPPIVGALIDVLDAHVRGSTDHPAKIDITDQELSDMQAYLASL